MDKIIEGLLTIFVAIVCVEVGLVVYVMIDTIRCKFDSHKWKVSEDGMEKICERCGISCADYSTRQSQQRRFRFLAFLRYYMKLLKEKLIGPTERYTESGRIDPFYHPSNLTKFGRSIQRLFVVLIWLIGLYLILMYFFS